MRMNADKNICGLNPDSDFVNLAAEILRVLSDPTRIKIILALRNAEELPVSELAKITGKNPSGVSQHLAKMRMARMVTTRQEGTHIYYRLADEHALAIVVEAVKQAEHSISNGQIPPHHHTK